MTTFYVDEEGTFHYDNLDGDTPGYTNNEFAGDWQPYYSDTVLVANWGDHRIPESSALDTGKDSFYPAYKYQQYGWKAYLEEQKKREEGETLPEWWR